MDDRIRQQLGALLAYAEQHARDHEHEAERRRRELHEDHQHRERIEKMIHRAIADLPDRVIEHVERKIYELRLARWEAHQSGAPSGLPLPVPPAAPPVPVAVAEQPSGQIQVRRDDTTRPFMLQHGDETYVKASGLWKLLKVAWPIVTALSAIAASIYAWWATHVGHH